MSVAPLREEETGWYLYGVVAAGAAAPDAEAVDPSHAVTAVAEGRVAGLASHVSLAEFDEASLAERLGDADWLEAKIRAHEQVLETALAATAVVPCRFCTVYRDERELRRFLAEREGALTDALQHVAGRVELGVKAFAAHEASEGRAAPESGRAYLEARKQERDRREELGRARAGLAARLHERLLAACDDGVPLDLQSREASGRRGEMVFNGAYLVGDLAPFETALVDAAGECREAGIAIELTGPWPPYNFVPEALSRA